MTTTHHLHEENLEHALRPVIDPDGQVHVSAWSATGKPVRFALSYHARAASKAGGVRAKLIGTVEELLPLPAGHGWFLTWDSADRVYHFEARVDPLYETVPMPPILPPEKIDLSAVPVGIFDDRSPFTLNILDSDGATHYLIIGASGSGKSGPQMGLIRQLSPLIQIGVVRLWLFDPKGGMEFRVVKDLASGRFAVTKTERDKLRKQLQTELRSKADRLARAGMDKITTPTVEFPLDVVICDEVLSEVRDGKPAEFEEVLQIGRAAGMAFLAASQSPKLNDLPFKDLFLRILALRQARKHHVDMVLGDGARESGALCDKINEQTMRGVGYQAIDGQATMRRFRCAFTPQEERKRICVIYSRLVGQEPPASTRPVPAGQQPSLLEPDQIEPGSQVAVSELQPGDRFQWEGDPDPAVFVGAQEHDEGDRVLVDYTYGDSPAREADAEWTEMVTFLERPGR